MESWQERIRQAEKQEILRKHKKEAWRRLMKRKQMEEDTKTRIVANAEKARLAQELEAKREVHVALLEKIKARHLLEEIRDEVWKGGEVRLDFLGGIGGGIGATYVLSYDYPGMESHNYTPGGQSEGSGSMATQETYYTPVTRTTFLSLKSFTGVDGKQQLHVYDSVFDKEGKSVPSYCISEEVFRSSDVGKIVEEQLLRCCVARKERNMLPVTNFGVFPSADKTPWYKKLFK